MNTELSFSTLLRTPHKHYSDFMMSHISNMESLYEKTRSLWLKSRYLIIPLQFIAEREREVTYLRWPVNSPYYIYFFVNRIFFIKCTRDLPILCSSAVARTSWASSSFVFSKLTTASTFVSCGGGAISGQGTWKKFG